MEALAQALPKARPLTLALPHLDQVQRFAHAASARSEADRGTSGVSVAMRRGLMPLLLSVAVQCAARLGASMIVTGLSRMIDATGVGLGSTDGRPDRLREFTHAYSMLLDTMPLPPSGVELKAPLMDLTYAHVMTLACRFEVPLERTWTCAESGARPCGQCEPCTARAYALAEADLVDPLLSPVTA